MVGIPKSNRCSFCKLRKTKCDEAWPTCATCKRAGRECSGPPNYKFIINGNHSTPAVHRTSPPRGPKKNTRVLKVKVPRPASFHGGASVYETKAAQTEYRCLAARLSRPMTISRAPECIDELLPKLIYCLEASAETLHDLNIWGSSLRLLPPLLDESETLRHAVELTTTAWFNVRSGQPVTACLDLQLYNKALQSLQYAVQEALKDPHPRIPTATLAAQTLVQKVEIAFDATRAVNRENHSAGIRAAISAGGPRQAFSELDVHLIFENFLSMLKNDVIEGRDSIFSSQSWAQALRNALGVLPMRPSILCQFYHFWIEMASWPSLVKALQQLHHDPSNSMPAMELALRASAILEYLREVDTSIFLPAMGGGDIVEVESHHGVDRFSTSYDFSSYELGSWFGTHALFGVLISRILQSCYSFLGHIDESIEETANHYSRRLWLTYPYMELRKPLELDGTLHLSLSYEAGTVVERAAVVAALGDGNPNSLVAEWTETTITANALAFTGRLPFVKTQDPNVEFQRVGCRC